MNGKEICQTLKAIRSEIAGKNDIPYKPHECTHTGDCAGTCPACEAEVRTLEAALEKRKKNGFKIVLAGLTAGLIAMNTVSCDNPFEEELGGILPAEEMDFADAGGEPGEKL